MQVAPQAIEVSTHLHGALHGALHATSRQDAAPVPTFTRRSIYLQTEDSQDRADEVTGVFRLRPRRFPSTGHMQTAGALRKQGAGAATSLGQQQFQKRSRSDPHLQSTLSEDCPVSRLGEVLQPQRFLLAFFLRARSRLSLRMSLDDSNSAPPCSQGDLKASDMRVSEQMLVGRSPLPHSATLVSSGGSPVSGLLVIEEGV